MAAFASSLTEQTIEGNKMLTMGTYVSTGGATGGDIPHGLQRCEQFFLQAHGAATTALAVVNETLPATAATGITIKTEANGTGGWLAIGT